MVERRPLGLRKRVSAALKSDQPLPITRLNTRGSRRMNSVLPLSGSLTSPSVGDRPRERQALQQAPASAPPAGAEVKPVVALPAALAEANRALAGRGSELTFEMDAESGRIIVKLIDKDTGEVLRQIPSPEMLRIARALRDGENGALLQANA